jgi:hypothetical protein
MGVNVQQVRTDGGLQTNVQIPTRPWHRVVPISTACTSKSDYGDACDTVEACSNCST